LPASRPRSARQAGSLSSGAAAALQGRRAEYRCPTTGQGNERGASAFLLWDNLSQGGATGKGDILPGAAFSCFPTGQREADNHRVSFVSVEGGAMAEFNQKEEYTYRIENITFIVTPSYKDSGETMYDILLNLMLADLATA